MTPKSFRAVGVGFQEPVIRPDHIAGFRSEAFDIRHSVKHNRDGAGGPVVAGQVDADLLQFPVERPEGNSLRVSPQNVPARLHEYLPRFRPNGGKLSFPGTLLLFARPFRALGLHIKIENPACCIGIGGNSAVLYQSFEDRVDDSERIFVILLLDVPSSRYKRVPYLGRGELFSILKHLPNIGRYLKSRFSGRGDDRTFLAPTLKSAFKRFMGGRHRFDSLIDTRQSTGNTFPNSRESLQFFAQGGLRTLIVQAH